MGRGYFGIGIYKPKTTVNIGTLWRSAHNMGADFLFTISHRYYKQPSDTGWACRHVPMFHYTDWQDFLNHLPAGCDVVVVEQFDCSRDLAEFVHPESCVYVLGAEDYGVPEDLALGHQKVKIKTLRCLNVAVAGSIVMYDRMTKRGVEVRIG